MEGTLRLGESQRVCAVCARVLDWYENRDNPSESYWDHALQDQPADHPVVVTTPDQIHARYRCDFCNADEVTPGWVIPARNFPMPGGVGMGMSDGDWGACDECEKLIAEDNWQDLILRVIGPAEKRSDVPRDVMAARLARMYHRLRQNITGEPFRLPAESPRWKPAPKEEDR